MTVPRRMEKAGNMIMRHTESDSHIQEEIILALRRQLPVEEAEVSVTVQSGKVTLTGTVASLAEKMAANGTINSIPGVRDVFNYLKVRINGNGNKANRDNVPGMEPFSR